MPQSHDAHLGVSSKSLVNFCQRCFIALESVLLELVQWPAMAKRASISSEFAKLGFPRCVGLIDGSLLPLTQRPHDGGECYYNRK